VAAISKILAEQPAAIVASSCDQPQGYPKRSDLMIQRLILSVLTCSLFLWNVGARAETKASPNAVVKCGPFSGMKDRPGWETPATYKIEGNKVSFERILTSGDETQAWSGVKGQSGQIMLVGEGGNKNGQWAMEFSGKWVGENKTKLIGKFTSTSGISGSRNCEINM
jgi:hypothetical protein